MSEQLICDTRRSIPGFRFSLRDAAVIAIGTLATAWLWGQVGSLSLVPLGVLVHFFLFCNVFRVRTRFELIWASSFIVNAGVWQLVDDLSWQGLLGSQLVITVLVIGAELHSPSYRGIGHRWIRPDASRRPGAGD